MHARPGFQVAQRLNNAQMDAAIAAAISGAIGALTTDDIPEGAVNFYFTDERVDDRVNDLLVAGAGIDLTYNDVANTLTIAATTLGTVTSVGLIGDDGIGISGSPILSSGDITLTLGNITPDNVTTGTVSATSVTDSSLVAGRVTFAGTGGLLVDDAQFTFNAAANRLTVAEFETQSANIDGGTIDGTIIGGVAAAAGTFTALNATSVVTGVLTATGAFTSVGIDDNATAEVLDLVSGNTVVNWGTSGANWTQRRNVDDQIMFISGGNSANAGGNIVLHGGTNADASDFILRADSSAIIKWDDSANTLYLSEATEIGGATGLLISTSGNITNLVNTSSTFISGDLAISLGANLGLYGSSHATLANDIKARVGTTQMFGWDDSINTFEGKLGGATSAQGGVILAAQLTGVSVGNIGTGEDDLITYSLPANAFSNNNKGIRYTAWGTFANNGNTKTVNVKFGTTTVATIVHNTSTIRRWYASAIVFRTSSGNQDYVAYINTSSTTGLTTSGPIEIGTSTQTDSSAITVKCTGTGTNNNDVVQEGSLIEFLH